MSDTTAVEPQGAPADPATATPATPAEPAADTTDWKAEARKWESRAKENTGAAQRLAEFEESQKTEAQKLADRAEKAESALAAQAAENLRLSVIAKHQIPVDYQDLIHGSDTDALEASAKKVASLIAPAADGKRPAVGPYVPPEGSNPNGPAGTPEQAFAEHIRAQLQR